MTKPWNRRRLLQAALGVPLLKWHATWAQTPGRTLQVEPRPAAAAPGVAAPSGSLLTAPRRALVIGNSSYAVGPLKNPANDAKGVADALRGQGFEVTLGLDLKRSEMVEMIGAYGQSLARTKPVALFYFAGHGLQVAWRNYLVPVDAAIKASADVQAQCVDVNAVIEGIGKAANPMNVIVLDACRNDPFGRSEQKGLSQLDAPPGTLLAFATSPGNVASDGEGVNGLYTEHLLREMKVPEAKIEDVFKRVRLGVRRGSNGRQIPWESTSLEEDFWFIPPRELMRVAQEAAERRRQEQEAERRRQEQEAERLRQEQEAERRRKAQLEQARQEDLERVRREQDAERRRNEQLERARQEELERERRAQDAERARRAALERARLEQIEKARQGDAERLFNEEFALWERVDGATVPSPLEDYLRRYPSGRFSELAQLQLDTLLARQGEQRIQLASSEGNPFTQGSARADVDYKVGDSYAYVRRDRDTKENIGKAVTRVTQVSDTQVIFNDGRLIYDRLGNAVKLPNGDRFTPRQDQPLEYSVGKKWSTRYSMKNEDKGVAAQAEFHFRIAGREKVTVPAGTFDCFVIEGDGWSTTTQGFQMRLGLKRWMAPDKCRRPIVIEQFRQHEGRVGQGSRGNLGKAGQFAVNERQELVAFSQS